MQVPSRRPSAPGDSSAFLLGAIEPATFEHYFGGIFWEPIIRQVAYCKLLGKPFGRVWLLEMPRFLTREHYQTDLTSVTRHWILGALR